MSGRLDTMRRANQNAQEIIFEHKMFIGLYEKFYKAIVSRVLAKVNQGERGWDDPTRQFELLKDLQDDVNRAVGGDTFHFTDIAARAGMLWWHAIQDGRIQLKVSNESGKISPNADGETSTG